MLRCDLFTLNFNATSIVMYLNSVQNLSEIESFTTELLTIQHVFAVQF